MSNDHRPINLDPGDILFRFRLPLTAWVSLAHRASGVLLFAGMAGLLWGLGLALESPAGLAELKAWLATGAGKFWTFVVLAALAYHVVAGTKHLLLDFGIGEELAASKISTNITVVVAVILIIGAGVWVW